MVGCWCVKSMLIQNVNILNKNTLKDTSVIRASL